MLVIKYLFQCYTAKLADCLLTGV